MIRSRQDLFWPQRAAWDKQVADTLKPKANQPPPGDRSTTLPASMPPGTHHPRWRPERSPCNLYNGMIAPLIPYAIKGAIWYQGESNAWSRAKR